MSRIDEKDRTKLFFRLTELPEYSLDTIGRRIDLLLRNTSTGEGFTLPATDDRLIKATVSSKGTDTLVSLYFRYDPQNAEAYPQPESSTLILDILPGNVFSREYPDLARKLSGITILNREATDQTNPVNISPWADDWPSFFLEYEGKVHIAPKPHFTLPPFPLASLLEAERPESWLPEKVLSLASGGQWSEALSELIPLLNESRDPRNLERLQLTQGELQVRSGRYEEPYSLLQQVTLAYPESRTKLLARYLFIYLQADQEDAHQAMADLNQLSAELPKQAPLQAYLTLLQAEMALATGQPGEARTMLNRDDIAFAGTAGDLRLLRQADLRYQEGKKISALVSYLHLLPQGIDSSKSDPAGTIIANDPLSLANFSDCLYAHKRMIQAEKGYSLLTALLTGTGPLQGLAMFRHAMSKLRSDAPYQQVEPELLQVQDSFPGTEGANRAQLRTTDYLVLEKGLPPTEAARRYRELSQTGINKDIREEAAFKEALCLTLGGDDEASVRLLMQILRDFHNGRLKIETRALLVQKLPNVIKNLISKERYVDALVLARQNRLFFSRGWLDLAILYKLAEAYSKLGVYDRAAQTYRFILDTSAADNQEAVFLPLITVLLADEQYPLVEDYADQYFFRYPDGKHRQEIFETRISALILGGDLEKAARLLEKAGDSMNRKTMIQAVRVFFDLHRHEQVIALFSGDKLQAAEADADLLFRLAESQYATGEYDKAAPHFDTLASTPRYKDQAMYRKATILREQGRVEESLNLLKKLAETGRDPLWVKLAREESAYQGINR